MGLPERFFINSFFTLFPMYVKVLLFSAPYSSFTYSLPGVFDPSFWTLGQRVAAPMGKTLKCGIIAEFSENSDLPDTSKCKDICWPLETSNLFKADLLALINDLALRQGIQPGFIWGHVLPQGLRDLNVNTVWTRGAKKILYSIQKIAKLPLAEYAELAGALCAGAAVIARPKINTAELEIYSLAIDPPWPLRPAAKKQIEVLDYLYESAYASRKRLMSVFGSEITGVVHKLLEKGLLNIRIEDAAEEIDPVLAPPPEAAFQLNEDQISALANLREALKSGKAQTRLLHGVTGSGKTAVYLALARTCLERGKSVLLLAPEVALAHKLYRDVEKSLPDFPHYLYHGYQSALFRERIFRELGRQTTPVIVVGTRSALFLPIAGLACVILDEEHDSSYKQDDVFVYHAKELAWQRMGDAGGLLVLGSATPDIRAYYAARAGQLPMLSLPRRAAGKSLPPVELARLGSEINMGSGNSGLLTEECEDALGRTLEAGEQAVILLNRRGYAPLIYCLGCEQTIHCPNCQIGLAFHKSLGRLVCHYCGYSIPWPGTCPGCGGGNYLPIGEGTERIAERLAAMAGKPILRLDRDSARRAGKIDEILTAFAKGGSPFLVGTQMLSKGHHFPNVTLVVVADGDIGLNLPDYRAAERTFQLLAQSAGRAGRGEKPGRAIIQTRNPDHYCWRHIVNYNYESFYEEELSRRKKRLYPPFVKLGLLRFSFPADDEEAAKECREVGGMLRQKGKSLDAIVLGPTPAPIAILRGKKRLHCLIKAAKWQPMRDLWFFAVKNVKNKEIKVFLDMDPVNMM